MRLLVLPLLQIVGELQHLAATVLGGLLRHGLGNRRLFRLLLLPQFVEGVEQLRTFIREQPQVAEVASAREIIGQTLAKQQRFGEAAGEFGRLLSTTPGRAETHGPLGDAYLAQGRYAEAVAEYDVPEQEWYFDADGQGAFVDDIPLAGALHVAFVRSPFARAKINGIDAAANLFSCNLKNCDQIEPGVIAFTSTPWGAASKATDFVRPITPALAAA